MSKTENAIVGAVVQGVKDAAADRETSTTARDVGPVSREVVKQLSPIIEHITNNEPWYQSRVTWGAIGAIALPLLGLVGINSDIIDADQFVGIGLSLGTVASGALTLYGRWKAKRPIGT